MKPKLLLRIASFCVLFFAVGHATGHFTRKSSVTDPQALAVFKAMEGYKFPIGSQFRSYDEFYTGMSINLIITLITFTLILWFVSGVNVKEAKLSSQILWPVLFCMVAFCVTSFLFFFLVPAITCLVASILIVLALVGLQKQSGRRR